MWTAIPQTVSFWDILGPFRRLVYCSVHCLALYQSQLQPAVVSRVLILWAREGNWSTVFVYFLFSCSFQWGSAAFLWRLFRCGRLQIPWSQGSVIHIFLLFFLSVYFIWFWEFIDLLAVLPLFGCFEGKDGDKVIPFRDDLSYNWGYQRILIGLSFSRLSKACRYTAHENGIKSNEDKKAN